MTATVLAFDGDALWGPCPDGGTMDFRDGEPIRSGGLSGAVYISLFGGNVADDGTPGSKLQYWGNHIGNDEPIRGRLEALLQTLPMTSSNLRRVEETALEDLEWMTEQGVATEIVVEASMQSARFLLLAITITSENTEESFRYRTNWLAGASEPDLTC